METAHEINHALVDQLEVGVVIGLSNRLGVAVFNQVNL